MGALQRIPNPLRMREELAQVMPYQGIELVCWAVTRVAARLGLHIQPLNRTPASVVAMTARARQGRTGRLTPATAHQCPQQIRVDFVVTGGSLLVQTQFGLDIIEVCLTHQGRDSGDEGPRLMRCGVSARSGFAY